MSINNLEKNSLLNDNSSVLYLIIFVCLVAVIYYCYYNNPMELFNNSRNRTLLSSIYGSHSARFKHNEYEKEEDATPTEEKVFEIGHDEKDNKIYKYKNAMYLMDEENTLVTTEPKNITYKKVQTTLPVKITANKIKSLIPLNFKNNKFRGLINNHWYRQYYILYEKEYDNQNFKNKFFTYLLVKNIDGKLSVVHRIPPREKINFGDTIYFSYGNFQLGPLVFV